MVHLCSNRRGYANRLEADSSFIGAGAANAIGGSPPYPSSTQSAIVSGGGNTVGASGAFIGAGLENTIVGLPSGDYGELAFIGAGYQNSIAGSHSAIVAGELNQISADDAIVVGGASNVVSAGAEFANVGGGSMNIAGAEYSTVSGGSRNSVAGQYGTIAGGFDNNVNGLQAVVSGGYGNVASGRDATIPGGASNSASGARSFAAGFNANAATTGAFVWADDSSTTALTSNAPNQFLARAAGGFVLYSAASLKSGVKLAPGSGSWSSLSDRAAKTGVISVDDARILEKVATLPVSEWSYTEQGTGVRHIGPMAQDFRAAFGLGEDERHISAVDEEGVALAAIKGLQSEVAQKDRELKGTVRALKLLDAKYEALEKRLEAVERRAST